MFFITSFLSGQSLQKFEPPDGRIIHGLGQYVAFYYTDQEYLAFVSGYQDVAENTPVIYSAYAFIDPFVSAF